MAKILLIDLETFGFDFSADKGFILCGSYKWIGENKVHTITHKDREAFREKPNDDKEICRRLAEVIEEADLVVTWNGKSFDMRFLQTRMLKHRLGYLPPVPHEDALLTARARLKMRRSLDNVQKFFGLGHKKTDLNIETWMSAGAGNWKALQYVIHHCEQDVLVLEEAYNLISPMSRVHPSVAIINGEPEGCPFCGKKHLNSRGKIQALRHYRNRFHCRACGRWSTSDPIKHQRRK